MPLVAGIDCSTQSTKALIVDAESGDVVATGRAEHSVTGADGARETDPEQWWEALQIALAQTGRARDVAAISVAAQQHGLVVTDDEGRPLRPAVLWNDVRSAAQAEELIQSLGGAEYAATLIGSVPLAAFTVTSWMWIRDHEPGVAARTRAVRLPHDWLNEKLTGAATTDRGDVSATGWWSSVTDTYLEEILQHPRVEIDSSMLPTVLGPGDCAGQVTAQAAAFLGLREGIPVAAGTGDNPAAALGLGLTEGETVLSLGTSGTVYTVKSTPTADPSGLVVGLADATGHYLPLACTINCTQAVDRVAELFGVDRNHVDHPGDVTVMPFFDGERTPYLPHASATITGLRHDTTPAQILGAAYEGAVLSLLKAAELVTEDSDLGTSPLLLIGGGAKGRAWQDTVRRLSGRPIIVPSVVELVAIGAAAQAAGLLHRQPAVDVAASWDTRRGERHDAATRDDERIERMNDALSRAEPLFGSRSTSLR
ncbi:MAG: xylulokinase [Actinomycetota bacterium]|nr:xylulokinase [Actinomycetota bacterium]